ncbi:putative mitochondrial carrier C16C10.1 [Bienertia sinuspersici]
MGECLLPLHSRVMIYFYFHFNILYQKN